MSLVDEHPAQDPDRDDAQGEDASRARGGDSSPAIRKGPAALLREQCRRVPKRRLIPAGAVLALALAALYVWGPFHSPHKPELRSQGYTGTRTDSGRPSPDWTKGADIAWRLERRIVLPEQAAVVKNGDQVVLFHQRDGLEDTEVVSLDVSGVRPITLWRSSLPHEASYRAERQPVLMGNDLFAGTLHFDLATGSRAPAPWAGREGDTSTPPMIAITSYDGVVIACDKYVCSGWEEDGDQWTMKWERDSAPTPLSEYEYCPDCGAGTWVPLIDRDIAEWGRATDPFTEWGATPSTSPYGKRIINTETGEVRSLCLDETKSKQTAVYSTADGWVAANSRAAQATVFAPDGRPLESFTIADSVGAGDRTRALAVGGRAPTNAQLRDFLTTGEAAWAEGVLRASPTPDDRTEVCGKLSFTPTDSDRPSHETTNESTSIAMMDKGECAIRAKRPAISEDHSALYLRRDAYGENDTFDTIFDMHGTSVFHTSGTTHTAGVEALPSHGRSVRVYDDLVLVIDYNGISALTPRGS